MDDEFLHHEPRPFLRGWCRIGKSFPRLRSVRPCCGFSAPGYGTSLLARAHRWPILFKIHVDSEQEDHINAYKGPKLTR